LEPASGDHQGGGAARQPLGSAQHQDGRAALHGALQSQPERERRRLPAAERQLAQVHRHQGEARAADEQIHRAAGGIEPATALHPEQAREIGARGEGRRRIEGVRSVHDSGPAARGRDSGNQGQEQAAAA
jgi:hypothetical protein